MIKQLLKLFTLGPIIIFGFNVQSQTTHTVLNTNDTGANSLRQAIIDANPNDTIRFDPTLIANADATINLTSEISFSKPISIIGLQNHSYSLIISGNDANRIFSISNAGNVVLDSVVLTNGYRASGSGYGGAINFISSDTLFLRNSTIKSSVAFDGGGGIFASSVVKIENSTMNDNGGYMGGAILTSSNEASILIKNSTINDNEAYIGGAIATDALSISASTLTINIEGSTIVNNTAASTYGGIYATVQETANVNITNSTIWGNNGTGANCLYIISNSPSNASIQNNIFWQNSGNPISVTNITFVSDHNIFNNAPTYAGTTDNINISNVNLGALALNGGTTKTMVPSMGSIAINGGNPSNMDDAQNRPIVGVRDIGAAEYNCAASTLNETIAACDSFTWKNGITYTSSTSGVNYTKFNVAAGACDSVYVLDLTINHPNTGDTTAVACGDFIWYGTNYTSTGNPTHILTNIAGCDSVVTLNLTINNVDVTTTANGANLSANVSGATYQWLDCDNANAPIAGATSQDYTATANGNYAVEVTENGCVDTSACMSVNSLGLENLQAIGEVSIYPNPTNDNVFIKLASKSNENYQAIVYNMLGKVILTKQLSNTTTELNTLHLESGVYLIEINNQKTKETYRLVKN